MVIPEMVNKKKVGCLYEQPTSKHLHHTIGP